MDDRYYWCIEAERGKVSKNSLWPLFTDIEVGELVECYSDHRKVYADGVINRCCEKGLTLASINGTPDDTVYHLVRNPQPPQPTIISEMKET